LKKIVLILLMLTPLFTAVQASGPVTTGPSFTINPNPVNGSYFNVNLDFTETQYPAASIVISNVLGQVVYNYPLKPTDFANGHVRIELSDAKLDKGVYFVQVKSGESTKTQKLAVR